MLHVGMIDGRGDKIHDIAARTAVSWRRGERLVLRPAFSLPLQLISARVAAVCLALASMRMIASASLCRSCETFLHAVRISAGRGTTTRRCHMKAKSVLSAGLGALALALVASAAQAAPAGGSRRCDRPRCRQGDRTGDVEAPLALLLVSRLSPLLLGPSSLWVVPSPSSLSLLVSPRGRLGTHLGGSSRGRSRPSGGVIQDRHDQRPGTCVDAGASLSRGPPMPSVRCGPNRARWVPSQVAA